MIPQFDLTRQYRAIGAEIQAALGEVLSRGRFVLGPEGAAVEAEIAARCGTRYAIGCASGTDALRLALEASGIGRGDEVITSAFSFMATASVICQAGARPVFVDIDPDTFNLDPSLVERAITPRTRAVLPVHLFGHPAEMATIGDIAGRHGLIVIEDAAQAIGARYNGRPVGSLGQAGCFSFYPTKNLGAYGDGGMVTTDSPEVAESVLALRNQGSRERYHHTRLGYNSRLDELQAAVLRVKLRYLDAWTEARRRIAVRYRTLLSGTPVTPPSERTSAWHVYHHVTIRAPRRDELAKFLAGQGIGAAVHYPHPLPAQEAMRHLGWDPHDFSEAWRASQEVLSLPCFPELTDEEVETVAAAIRRYYE